MRAKRRLEISYAHSKQEGTQEKTYVHIKTCTWKFIATLFIITSNSNVLLWHIHTEKYYPGANYWDMQQQGWSSNTLCSVEADRCKRLHTVGSHSYDFLEKTKPWGRRAELWLPGDESRGKIRPQWGSTREFWEAIKLFCCLIAVAARLLSKFIKLYTHKKVNFTVCEFFKMSKNSLRKKEKGETPDCGSNNKAHED